MTFAQFNLQLLISRNFAVWKVIRHICFVLIVLNFRWLAFEAQLWTSSSIPRLFLANCDQIILLIHQILLQWTQITFPFKLIVFCLHNLKLITDSTLSLFHKVFYALSQDLSFSVVSLKIWLRSPFQNTVRFSWFWLESWRCSRIKVTLPSVSHFYTIFIQKGHIVRLPSRVDRSANIQGSWPSTCLDRLWSLF